MHSKATMMFLAAVAVGSGNAFGLGDDFNRDDSSDMGPNWTEQSSDWCIKDGMAQISGGSGWGTMTFNGFDSHDVTITVDVDYLGGPSDNWVGMVAGYADMDNHLEVKVFDHDAIGAYQRLYFYYGENGGGWDGMTGGSSLVVLPEPFTSARLSLTLTGDSMTFGIDRGFDGVYEDVFTRGGLPVENMGGVVGLTSYGSAAVLDNFVIVPAPTVMALLGLASLRSRRRR